MRMFARLSAVLAAVSAMLVAALPRASALDQVSFAFAFSGTGSIANFYATEDEGLFKKVGLDVTWVTPGNVADGVRLLASGQVQFAVVNSPDLVIARGRGVPIRSIFAVMQHGTAGIMAPVAKNVRTLKDLEGKIVGITGLPANKAMLLQVFRANGVDPDKVQIVNVGFGTLAVVLAGKVDALGDAITYAEPIGYNKALGKPLDDPSTITYFPFYKYGGPQYYANEVAVRDDYLAAHPDIVRRFAQGLRDGLAWSIANPDAAAKDFLKHFPQADPDYSTASWKAVVSLATSADTKTHGLGWQNENTWAEICQFLFDIKSTPAKVEPAAAYINME